MTPLKGYHCKYEVDLVSYNSPLCILNNICVKLDIHFSLEAKIGKDFFVPVEVSNPDGNFDTLGKSFFATL